MGLAPEIFILVGIAVFLAASLVSTLLDKHLPRLFQYLFQAAAAAGLTLLLMSRGWTGGTSPQNLSDSTRFWISIAYLAAAVSSEIVLNIYLAAARRLTALSALLSGIVTVPTIAIASILISSYFGFGGTTSLSAATVVIMTVSAVVACISLFSFLSGTHRFIFRTSTSQPTTPTPSSTTPRRENVFIASPSRKRDDEWETEK